MSFLEGARGEYNPEKANDDWFFLVSGDYPTLAQALAGSGLEVKASERIPPLTLMVFSKEGKLRASLSSRDFPRAFYLSIGDPRNVLASIEEALVNNQGEWSTKRAK